MKNQIDFSDCIVIKNQMTFTFQTTNPYGDMYQSCGFSFVNMKPEIHQYLNWKPTGTVLSRVIFGPNDSIYEYKTAISVVSIILRKNPQELDLAKLVHFIISMMKSASANVRVLNKMKISMFMYSANPIPYFSPVVSGCMQEILGEPFEIPYSEYEVSLHFGSNLEPYIKDTVSMQTYLVTDKGFQLQPNAFPPTPPPAVVAQPSSFGQTPFGQTTNPIPTVTQPVVTQQPVITKPSTGFGQPSIFARPTTGFGSTTFGGGGFGTTTTFGSGYGASFGTMAPAQEKNK